MALEEPGVQELRDRARVEAHRRLAEVSLVTRWTFGVPETYAGLFMLAIFGYLLNRLFLLAESRLIRWHHETSGRR